MAVSGMAMMLCFQNPAMTISSKGASADFLSRSRARNQTSAAPMIASPASCGSLVPTYSSELCAVIAAYQSAPTAAPTVPPTRIRTARKISTAIHNSATMETARPTNRLSPSNAPRYPIA